MNLVKLALLLLIPLEILHTEFINYLPDDIFIDNGDVQYSEVYGNWTTSTNSAWNLDSRIANLNGGDSAKVRWNLDSDYSGLHNLFVQFPEVSNHVDTVYFEFFKNGLIEDTITVSVTGDFKKWLYVTTVNLISGENNFIDMSAKNSGLILKTLAADVLKQTAYVRDRQINIKDLFIDGGEISIEDSLNFSIEVSNTGISQLTISDLYSTNGQIEILSNLPIQIEGMQKLNLPMIFIPEEIGNVEDTIVIVSDDPVNPVYKIPFNAVVENYFRIVDNDDTELYSETGTWYTSVAQAYGPSSRYAIYSINSKWTCRYIFFYA